jgi:hypothetical protein
MSTLITNSTYNNLQAAVARIMGIGVGNSGYGQPISSSQVVGTIPITVQQWNNLRTDLAKSYTHQTNVAVANTAATVSNTPPALQLITSNTTITNDIFLQYSNFTSNVNTNRLAVHPNQTTASVPVVTQTRSAAWGGAVDVISTTITVTFPGYTSGGLVVSPADHIRCFFNAGGSIQIRSLLSGFPSLFKNISWNGIFTTVGNFSFRSNNSSISGTLRGGSSVASTTGYHQLTGNLTQLLRQTGVSGTYYDVKYQENSYQIAARLNGNNQIVFVITYRDDDAGDRRGKGPAVDEEVSGTLSAIVTCTRPTGANVDVPGPTGSATAIG